MPSSHRSLGLAALLTAAATNRAALGIGGGASFSAHLLLFAICNLLLIHDFFLLSFLPLTGILTLPPFFISGNAGTCNGFDEPPRCVGFLSGVVDAGCDVGIFESGPLLNSGEEIKLGGIRDAVAIFVLLAASATHHHLALGLALGLNAAATSIHGRLFLAGLAVDSFGLFTLAIQRRALGLDLHFLGFFSLGFFAHEGRQFFGSHDYSLYEEEKLTFCRATSGTPAIHLAFVKYIYRDNESTPTASLI